MLIHTDTGPFPGHLLAVSRCSHPFPAGEPCSQECHLKVCPKLLKNLGFICTQPLCTLHPRAGMESIPLHRLLGLVFFSLPVVVFMLTGVQLGSFVSV